MANYYPLIAKAVAGLQNAQDRRTLYERGRAVLMAELESIRPPLGRTIIARERLAFEEAVREVETEIVHPKKSG